MFASRCATVQTGSPPERRPTGASMSETQVVTYALDDEEAVSIEITPVEGFVPVGVETVAGHVRRAVEPAIAAAREVLEQTRAMAPDTVQVKFGVKVTGT